MNCFVFISNINFYCICVSWDAFAQIRKPPQTHKLIRAWFASEIRFKLEFLLNRNILTYEHFSKEDMSRLLIWDWSSLITHTISYCQEMRSCPLWRIHVIAKGREFPDMSEVIKCMTFQKSEYCRRKKNKKKAFFFLELNFSSLEGQVLKIYHLVISV